MRILYVISLLFLSWNLFSQENDIKFNHLSMEDGLSQRVVRCILQDSMGYMYFATKEEGLNRYDGYFVQVFKHDSTQPNSLCCNRITSMCLDDNNNIWIATLNGLSCFDNKKNTFINFFADSLQPSSLLHNTVYSVKKDSRGLIWIATKKGLQYINPQEGVFHEHALLNSYLQGNNSFNALFFDRNGHLWLTSFLSPELIRFNPVDNKISVEYKFNNNISVLCFAQDPSGNICVGTNHGLFWQDKKKKSFQHYFNNPLQRNSLNANIVLSLYVNSLNELWVGTSKGLSLYIPEIDGFKTYLSDRLDDYSLSNNGIFYLYESANHYCWIATGEGLDYYDVTNRFKHFREGTTMLSTIRGNIVQAVYEDSDNTLWIGTKTGGLNKIYADSQFIIHYTEGNPKTGLLSNNVYSIIKTANQYLWIGTEKGGLSRLDVQNNTFKHYLHNRDDAKSISSNFVHCIHPDEKNPDILWIGTEQGINKFSIQKDAFEHYHHTTSGIPLQGIRFIVPQDSFLWLGGEASGVYRMNKRTQDIVPLPSLVANDDVSDGYIKALYLSSENILWIGSVLGVELLDLNTMKLKKINKTGDVKNFSCMGIVEDQKGILWLATKRNGIIRYDKYKDEGYVFNERMGVSNSFIEGAAWLRNNGNIIFGGTEGFIEFNPAVVGVNHFIGKVVLTGLYLFNEPVHPNNSDVLPVSIENVSTIRLSHDQNTIALTFSLMNFDKPRSNYYAYMLEGLEKYWNYVDNINKASYFNLKPGSYKFRVRGYGANQQWTKEKSVMIIIAPPFWKTWWFIILMVLTSLSLMVLFYLDRIKKIKKRELELEQLVCERTAEISQQNDELESQRDEIEKQRDELTQQSNIIENKNKDITDSIEYAKKIQYSIFPTNEVVDELLTGALIFFKPRDILSGDFYWIEKLNQPVYFDFNEEKDSETLFAAVDCTGHGVPGALMSIVGYMILNQAVKEQNLRHTNEILNYLDQEIKKILRRYEEGSRDGMDIALCKLDRKKMLLEYSGAFINLILIRNNEMMIYNPDRASIGSYLNEETVFFGKHIIQLQKGDMIYIYSDGYQDQMGGGEKRKKYSKQRLKNKLLEISSLDIDTQYQILDSEFNTWKGEFDQMDDILILGLKI